MPEKKQAEKSRQRKERKPEQSLLPQTKMRHPGAMRPKQGPLTKGQMNSVERMGRRIATRARGPQAGNSSEASRLSNGGVHSLLSSLSLPGAAPRTRAPPIYGSHATALASPWDTFELDLPKQTGVQPLVMGGQGFIAVSRNPACCIMYSTVGIPSFVYTASFNYESLTGSANVEPFARYPQLIANSEGFYFDLEPVVLTYSKNVGAPVASEPVYGNEVPTTDAMGHHYIFQGTDNYCLFNIKIQDYMGIDYDGAATETALQIFSATSSTTEVLVQLVDWDATNKHFEFFTDQVGYYRFAVRVGKWPTARPCKVLLKMFHNGDALQDASVIRTKTLSVGNFGSGEGNITTQRTNAVSCLLSNVSKELDKNGMIAATQLDYKENLIPYLTTDTPFDRVAKRNGMTKTPLETGAYGYARPAAGEVFTLEPVANYDDSSDIILSYNNPLAPAGGWLLFTYARETDVAVTLNVTVNFLVEFTSRSTWFDYGTTRPDIENWDAALQQIYRVPQFCENPLHLRDIANAIKHTAGAVARNSPAILSLLAKMFPAARIPAAAFQVAKVVSRL